MQIQCGNIKHNTERAQCLNKKYTPLPRKQNPNKSHFTQKKSSRGCGSSLPNAHWTPKRSRVWIVLLTVSAAATAPAPSAPRSLPDTKYQTKTKDTVCWISRKKSTFRDTTLQHRKQAPTKSTTTSDAKNDRWIGWQFEENWKKTIKMVEVFGEVTSRQKNQQLKNKQSLLIDRNPTQIW